MENSEQFNNINPLLIINKVVYNDIPVELNRVEKMVLISLINHNNWKTGTCNPSIKTIQNEWFYCNDREVIKALKSLREKNIFSKETIKRRNYYHLNIDLILDYCQNDGNCLNEGNLQNDSNNNCLNDGNGYCQNEGTNNEITIKKQCIDYSSLKTTKKKNSKKVSEEEINRIWNMYPKKQGKLKAIIKIPKLINEYGIEQMERCVKRYIEYVENERKTGFRELQYKNGQTFFNSGYMDYLDENFEEVQEEKSEKENNLILPRQEDDLSF